MLSGLAAAGLAFGVGRTALRPRCLRRIEASPTLRAVDRAVRDKPFATVLLLRLLVPLPPVVNYVYGATAAPPRSFLLATLVGNFPGTFLCVLAAKGLQLDASRIPPAAALGILVAILAAWAALLRASRAVQRHLLATQETT
mmetsp:Transcript_19568/g.77864  ORF Transcript_19568/g.77864 Transcript_19568/m.77864 type:complete len:142 (+) Transcript_19568:582-1007(+)